MSVHVFASSAYLQPAGQSPLVLELQYRLGSCHEGAGNRKLCKPNSTLSHPASQFTLLIRATSYCKHSNVCTKQHK